MARIDVAELGEMGECAFNHGPVLTAVQQQGRAIGAHAQGRRKAGKFQAFGARAGYENNARHRAA
jgi:hypothetical protein